MQVSNRDKKRNKTKIICRGQCNASGIRTRGTKRRRFIGSIIIQSSTVIGQVAYMPYSQILYITQPIQKMRVEAQECHGNDAQAENCCYSCAVLFDTMWQINGNQAFEGQGHQNPYTHVQSKVDHPGVDLKHNSIDCYWPYTSQVKIRSIILWIDTDHALVRWGLWSITLWTDTDHTLARWGYKV